LNSQLRASPRLAWLLLVCVGCKGPDKDDGGAHRPGTSTTVTEVPSCPDHPLSTSMQGDAMHDLVAATDPMFRSIAVPNITSIGEETGGAAWVDLDRDGDLDVVLSRKRRLDFVRNDGCFEMTAVDLDFDAPGADGLTGALAADLSDDGYLDLYVPSFGGSQRAYLLESDGAWDRFVDRAEEMGVANPGTYSRGGATLGDLNGDDWLDFAIAGHQIGGQVDFGRPLSALFVFRPGENGFSDGVYEDVAEVAAPGFGGVDRFQCTPGAESTGLDSLLADIDDDGHLDLIWPTHNDMYRTRTGDVCETGGNPYGLRVWMGEASADVSLVEQEEGPGSLADLGQMAFDPVAEHYVVSGDEALGSETVALLDFDNDGDRDLIAVGPTDPDWHISSEQVLPEGLGRIGALYRNDGGSWVDDTIGSDLGAIDWTLAEWASFFDAELTETLGVMALVCAVGPQRPLCEALKIPDRQPYPSHILPFDADNDGWIDFLYTIRMCVYSEDGLGQVRSVLFRNRGDGTFEPLVTETSGIAGCAIAAYAVDIDSDGWLDLHYAIRQEQVDATLNDMIFRNLGGDRTDSPNHWLSVALEGRPEAQLLGARLIARDESGGVVATGWYEREAWRGSRDPNVHLGLGQNEAVDLEIKLRGGAVYTFDGLATDEAISLSVEAR